MEKTQLSKEHLRNSYKKYVVGHTRKPSSVKALIEYADGPAEDFRIYYDSLKALELDIWAHYYQTTIEVLTADANFASFGLPEKHLAFLYTLLEVVSEDRDFVVQMLDKQFKLLLSVYLGNTRSVIQNSGVDWLAGGADSMSHLTTLSENVYTTALWQHSIWTLDFWTRDESEDFMDTDVFIEKTTGLFFNATDLSNIYDTLDLGKFLLTRSKLLSKWIKE